MMQPNETIRRLAALAAPDLGQDPRAPHRVAARMAWASATVAAWRAAHKRADDAWMALIADLPEDEDEDEDLPPPPEQAEVDALWAELNAVREHDRWPRELYFGEI